MAPAPRAPTGPSSAQGAPLAAAALALLAIAGSWFWIATELAALMVGHRLLILDTGALGSALAAFPRHAGDPRLAWPTSVARLLPGPTGFYAAGAVAAAVLVVLAVLGARLARHLARTTSAEDHGARWATREDLRPLVVRAPRSSHRG